MALSEAPSKSIQVGVLRALGLTGFLAALLLGFQNCGPSSSGALYPTEQEKIEALAKSLPFAYDVVYDRFAYMSCSQPQALASPDTFFTFKAGAYTPAAGVGFNLPFRREFGKQSMSLDMRREVIQASAVNANVVPQMDIRRAAQLYSVAETTNPPALGLSFDYMMDILAVSWIADPMLKLRSNEFLREAENPYTKQKAKAETSLLFYRAEGGMISLRKNLMDQDGTMVTLTFQQFTPGNSNGVPIAPPNTPTEGRNAVLYGRGYKPAFSMPDGANSQAWGERIMSSLTERRLEFNTQVMSPAATWMCPSNLRFMLVRNQDINADLQVRLPGEGGTTTRRLVGDNPNGDNPRMQLVRNVLPQERWVVDLAQGLVAPRNAADGACYDNAQTVQYDISVADCDTRSAGGNSFKACAHFVSICYRTGTYPAP